MEHTGKRQGKGPTGTGRRVVRMLRLIKLVDQESGIADSELAARLGVSERTVARDIAELAEAGIGVAPPAQQRHPGPCRS